ncbi:MAG: alanyl-tRNA editing protein [Alphaproteobacteria bacterium]|nr:alanyl-tRNA editing protein [Alphaproteobacteria bacterium]
MTQKLFLEDAYMQEFDAVVVAVLPNGIALDRTAFYATSGGQPGDTGSLNGVPVTDTIKSKEVPDQIIHVCDPTSFSVGQTVHGKLDWAKRHTHMRMHTALHLMCVLIKGYATGNSIGTDKSRIDFDVEMAELDKADIETRLNQLVAADYPVSAMFVDEAELDRNPALVRTLSVQPPRGSGSIRMVTIGSADTPLDRQPCGGTHVKTTGEIGRMAIAKVENKGKQNKRIILTFADGTQAAVAA